MRTRIKICGITRPEDALLAAELGVDAIGLVFHAPSARHVDVDAARAIVAGLPAFVTTVGLFVDAGTDTVRRVLEAVPLDLLQFHGDEEEAWCRRFGRPWIKALRVREGQDLQDAMAAHPGAAGILLDSWSPRQAGGTGETFDWDLVPERRRGALILAGGLNPGNVGDALRRLRPWAVDVSTGVEEAPGLKSATLMREFVNAVNSAEEAHAI